MTLIINHNPIWLCGSINESLKLQSVSELLKQCTALYDKILMYYIKHFERRMSIYSVFGLFKI